MYLEILKKYWEVCPEEGCKLPSDWLIINQIAWINFITKEAVKWNRAIIALGTLPDNVQST